MWCVGCGCNSLFRSALCFLLSCSRELYYTLYECRRHLISTISISDFRLQLTDFSAKTSVLVKISRDDLIISSQYPASDSYRQCNSQLASFERAYLWLFSVSETAHTLVHPSLNYCQSSAARQIQYLLATCSPTRRGTGELILCRVM